MNTPPLRCGIIGTGAFAPLHAQAIANTPRTSLIAVCDIDQAKAKQFSEQWGGKAQHDLKALLKEGDLELITIATPDKTHAGLIEDILKSEHRPKLIIVEKPLCTSRDELQAIKSHLRESETRLVVDHTRRFNAGFECLRQLMESGELGTEVHSVHFRYYAGWFHIGAHAIDTLRMLLGELSCSAASLKTVDRFPDDPLLDVELQSAKYPEASIHLEGIPEHPYALFEAEILLSQGRVRFQWDDVFIDRLRDRPSTRPSGSLRVTSDGKRGPLLWFSEHFQVEPVERAVAHLYDKSEALLKRGDRSILDIAGFEVTRRTMDILFDAKEKAGA